MKVKDYYKLTPRLQAFKKCLGCAELFDIDQSFPRCPNCGCKKFIPVTDYIREEPPTSIPPTP